MSTAVKTEIYEAEIVGPSPNPYQAPVACAKPSSEISEGIGRADPAKVRTAKYAVVAAEVTFVINCLFYLTRFQTMFGFNLSTAFFWISTIVAFFCFSWMVLSCNKISLTSLAMIAAFLVPVVGVTIYFSAKKQANRFLIWNGQRPGFLGAKPDPDEIRLMNKDPHYRPASLYHHDGSRRWIAWSLSDCFIGLIAFLGVTAAVVGLVIASYA